MYIAVLGTSLIVALLGMAAMMGQRIQNRITAASADIRQAELNANTAVELALLTMKQDANWRTTQPHGRWFTGRGTGAGTCSLDVSDPLDNSLANDADHPVVIRGIGYSGQAEQRVHVTIDPRKPPLGCLRSAIAAGDLISLNSDTLRTGGLITANQVTAASSHVYGSVEALSVSGSTYYGTTTQIDADERPDMPDWAAVVNHYRSNGTELSYGSLPSSPTTNSWGFARNWSIESGTTDWAGAAPGLTATAQISQSNNWSQSGSYSLRVQNRSHWSAGAVQHIAHFVKPGQQYDVDVSVYAETGLLFGSRAFRLTVHVKGSGSASEVLGPSASATCTLNVLGVTICSPARITGRLTAPSWSGDLEYAYVKVSDDSTSGSTAEFWLDDLSITEVASGKYIYRKVLSPGFNNLYGAAPTNSQGIYWINCNGGRLTIERSRIFGTLLVLNPGSGSSIAHGPISWSPAVAGYPALVVGADNASDADFTISASNRVLSEAEQRVNYNPAGAAHEQFGQDALNDDIYPSEIRGLVAIGDDLTYANRTLVRGQVIVGDDIANSSGELEVIFQPDSLLNPPPGFTGPYSYQRRPASARKAVLP